MKPIKLTLLQTLTLCFLLAVGCSTTTSTSDRPGTQSSGRMVKSEGLRPFTEHQLSNGLTVLLIEDRTLPYFSLGLLIPSGGTADPIGKSGLRNFVARLLSKGTTRRTATEIAEEFGRIAAEFEVNVGDDFTYLSSSTLAHFQNELLAVFTDVLTAPVFTEAEISRLREQTLSTISRRVDEPSSFADELYSSYLFGRHPYSRSVLGSSLDVKTFSRKVVTQDYLKFFRPNGSYLTVVGNFSGDIQEKLEDSFKHWLPRSSGLEPRIATEPPRGIQVRFVDKPGLVQSQIRIGHLGIQRTDPDYLVLRVANMVLGGSFGSRLMDQIRVNLGLTYGISSQFEANLDRGAFTISTSTQNERVGYTISETLKVLQKFREGGATDSEVQVARNLLIGRFPQSIETPEKLVFNMLSLRFYGIGDDYLTRYREHIESISTNKVNLAIRKHLSTENLKILVFGSGASVAEQLRPFGAVETRSYREFQ